MIVGNTKKNKINLEDYDYKRDIENRIMMAHFTTLDVDVLDEILNSSLKVSIEEISEQLEEPISAIMPSLDKLLKTGLFKIEGHSIIVDKEMRKYYDFQIMKFDEDFKPGMEFFQGLLRKVPIHVLPSWYMISRTSDNIFQSLVEKYLLYPKNYQRYLEELNFEDPIFNDIIDDLFSSPELQLRSHDIREKYNLSREEFEEYMLHLEFNCVCCLRYKRLGQDWKEIVTPFYEWGKYLQYLADSTPHTIEDVENIETPTDPGHAFVSDMTSVIKAVKEAPLTVQEEDSGYSLAERTAATLLSQCKFSDDYQKSKCYLDRIIIRIIQMRMGEVQNGKLMMTELAGNWLRMTDAQRSLYILKHPRYDFIDYDVPKHLMTLRNHRHVEHSLESVASLGWIYFEDYMKTMTSGIGDTDPVMLKKRGRHWAYALPKYSPEERRYIEASIFEKLFEAGQVEIGTHHGKPCFKVIMRH
ncbi:MAG: hypothetical protein ACQEP8_01020 [Chlamydiota bacterium]